MTGTPCPRCTRDTTDGLLCVVCCRVYINALDDLRKYTAELPTNYVRLDRTARSVQHVVDRSLALAEVEAFEQRMIPAMLRTRDAAIALPANPIPVNLSAGELLAEVAVSVRGWRKDERWLRGQDDPRGIVDTARRLARTVERAIDRTEPDLFLGRCDTPDVTAELDETGTVLVEVDAVCGAELYARLGDKTVFCEVCGWEYPVGEQRDRMLAAVRDVLARPKVIADALTSLDLPLNAGTLDVWISRDKRMHQQGRERPDGLPLILADPVTDDEGKCLYRVGPVIDRVEAMRDPVA